MVILHAIWSWLASIQTKPSAQTVQVAQTIAAQPQTVYDWIAGILWYLTIPFIVGVYWFCDRRGWLEPDR